MDMIRSGLSVHSLIGLRQVQLQQGHAGDAVLERGYLRWVASLLWVSTLRWVPTLWRVALLWVSCTKARRL